MAYIVIYIRNNRYFSLKSYEKVRRVSMYTLNANDDSD